MTATAKVTLYGSRLASSTAVVKRAAFNADVNIVRLVENKGLLLMETMAEVEGTDQQVLAFVDLIDKATNRRASA